MAEFEQHRVEAYRGYREHVMGVVDELASWLAENRERIADYVAGGGQGWSLHVDSPMDDFGGTSVTISGEKVVMDIDREGGVMRFPVFGVG